MLNAQKMYDERQRLEEQIKSIDLEISRLPRKHIICAKNGAHYKWYESDGKTCSYIPKKKREYAEKLAKKKYLTLLRNDLIQERNAIDFYLRHHVKIGGKAEELLAENAEYANLLSMYFRPISQELLEWKNSPYQHNELYQEKLIHKTSAGIYVRSKSEALITMFLNMKKIPFHYEELLMLGDTPYYPDFTIRHPRTGQIYYWEHFGMMDVPEYMKSTFSKMQTYTNHGIIPGVNLITTFETKEHPLEFEMVARIVEYYFED